MSPAVRALGSSLVLLVAACSIETSGLRPTASVDGGDDSGGIDAAVDGGSEDAGAPPIVGPVTLGPAGSRNAHPAIVWTGAELVVAYFEDDGAGGRNVVARAAPAGGELTPEGPVTMTSGISRSSLSLAHSMDGTAIGWVEGEGTGELHVRVLPSMPRGTIGDVEVHQDFDDAHVMWDRGFLLTVVRQRVAPNEVLTAVEFSPGPGMAVSVGMPRMDFGEIATASSAFGPLVVTPNVGVIHVRRDDLFWYEAHTLSFGGTPMEGDVVELAGGGLLGVFTVNDGTGLTLRSQRLESGGDGTWDAVLPETRLSNWIGPDPVVTTLGAERALLAWVDETSSPPPRPLALAVLDAAGMPLTSTPCVIAPERSYANDPDIACGGGYCAAIWLEANDLTGTDYVTRFVQLPVSARGMLTCPTP